MRNLFFLVIFLLSYSTSAADAEKGKNLYQTCIQCHGENGMGDISQKAPKLAGQFDWYIISSIKAFKEGKDRKNPTMLPFIKNLSDKDIENLAAYISTMKN